MVEIYDTTLRDGAQRSGISFSLQNKLDITKLLSPYLDYIEGGWPYSNPVDSEYFRRVSRTSAKIAAFGMTARGDAETDENLSALIRASPDVYTIFGKSWLLHVNLIEKKPDDYLQTIEKSVRRLKKTGKPVFYDAEHFYDGHKDNPDYAMKCLEAACNGGADMLVLCDTRGGCFPWEIRQITEEVVKNSSMPVGIHCHNDGGLALANTLEAIRAGSVHVQGTMNGLGERCGNLDLQELMCSLCKIDGSYKDILPDITNVSRKIAKLSRQRISPEAPYKGTSAFAHKGGVHTSAVLKNPIAYEHVEPEIVGNHRRFPLSNQSGSSAIAAFMRELGYEVSRDDPRVLQILERINTGGREIGDAQAYLMIKEELGEYNEPFIVRSFRTLNTDRTQAEATVEIEINGEAILGASKGDGEVNALDKALKKALSNYYPVDDVCLVDYDAPISPGEMGTEAEVAVTARFAYNGSEWSSIRSSTDLIKASFGVLVDSYKYYIDKLKSDSHV
ncbi:MAG: citramalate synthase [Candidatus Aenigmarchaeota archaeon]|nr:citramalate synthase [Candidatus Aenigmarchaeota archaeon]